MKGKIFLATLFLFTPLLLGDVQKIHREVDVEDISTVEISNVNGEVNLLPSEDTTLKLDATIKAEEEGEAKNLLVIEKKGDTLFIKIKKTHRSFLGIIPLHRYSSASMTIRTPGHIHIKASTVNGTISGENLHNFLHASTVNGRIAIQNHAGRVLAEAVNGSISIEVLDAHPHIQVESVNGNINLFIPSQASFSYTLETINGHLKVFGEAAHKLYGSKEMEGKIGDGEGRIEGKTINGSISIDHTAP